MLHGALAEGILDAWFGSEPSRGPGDAANIEHVAAIEREADLARRQDRRG